MSKIKWCFKQLLPLTYWTKFYQDDKHYFTIWNMWFGKSYNVLKFEIK